jgi:hypothetical protein
VPVPGDETKGDDTRGICHGAGEARRMTV